MPILTYHQFILDNTAVSSAIKLTLKDFQSQLQKLYDAGYYPVTLESWLSGDLRVPAGKRPIIFTMDDLFFADQIFVESDGTPSLHSGLGVYWQFSQQHPDFPFAIALFMNLGDKYYGNIELPDRFIYDDNWPDSLARVIAWCIEHNATPYNHFFTHPDLTLTEAKAIQYELRINEARMIELLKRIGKESLADNLDNMIALPYSKWPDTVGKKKLILNYMSLNKKPVRGIFENDYYFGAKFLPPVYSPKYDHFHIPRITASNDGVQSMVDRKAEIPTAGECQLGPLDAAHTRDGAPAVDASQPEGAAYLQSLVAGAGKQHCPDGVYDVGGLMFRLASGEVTQLEVNPSSIETTP
jgi:hypothetical protein